MKILAYEEVIIKLNNILNYNILDTKVNNNEVSYYNILDSRITDYKLPKPITITSLVDECLENLYSEDNDIRIGLEDLDYITKNKDLLVMSSANYYGDQSAQEAIQEVVQDIENNNLELINADGILICFQVNSDYSIMELSEGMDIISSKWHDEFMLIEPNMIFGVSCDNNFEDNFVKATLFISYSKKENLKYVNNFIKSSLI